MVFVYTPEVYPTRIRGVSMGVMTSAGRIGALVTPFIAQVRDLVLVAMNLYSFINPSGTVPSQ